MIMITDTILDTETKKEVLSGKGHQTHLETKPHL